MSMLSRFTIFVHASLALAVLMGSQRVPILPEKYEATENETGLTVERDLYNCIIELCADSALGVKAENKAWESTLLNQKYLSTD